MAIFNIIEGRVYIHHRLHLNNLGGVVFIGGLLGPPDCTGIQYQFV